MELFLYSFKKGVNPKIQVIPMLLLTTQQEINLLDFENKKQMFVDNPTAYQFFIIFMSISSTTLILIVA
tara:strand:+ start:292 stop:498 length:207 start_codon:yes stop_codon:yes gene_type:complete